MTMNGAEPKGLAYAARLMLDQLTLHRDRQIDLARRLDAERERSEALRRSIEVLLTGLAPSERAPLVRQLALIEGRGLPPRGTLGSTTAVSAVLAFLAAQEGDKVTVEALAAHIGKLDLTLHPRYAACTLNRLRHLGVVSRIKRALYRINRFHPELVAMSGAGRPDPPDAPPDAP